MYWLHTKIMEARLCLFRSKLVHILFICAFKCGDGRNNQWKDAYDRLLQLFDPSHFVPNAKLKLKTKNTKKKESIQIKDEKAVTRDPIVIDEGNHSDANQERMTITTGEEKEKEKETALLSLSSARKEKLSQAEEPELEPEEGPEDEKEEECIKSIETKPQERLIKESKRLDATDDVRWELLADMFSQMDKSQRYLLVRTDKFWNKVRVAMYEHVHARNIASQHPLLNKE